MVKSQQQQSNKDPFTHVNDVLAAEIDKLTKGRFSSSASVQSKWPDIVGKTIASHSQILYVKNDCVHIGTDNATWHNELVLMKDDIIRKINKTLPDAHIKELKFMVSPKAG